MPFKKEQYPPYWKMFSEYIRFERAGNKCEQCGAENYKTGKKGRDGVWRDEQSIHGMNSDAGMALYGEDFDFKCSKVVLTVAHLDFTGGICQCKKLTGFKCAKPDHVLALCQSCHLAMDLPRHIANRRETFIKRKDEVRGLLAEL